MKAIDKKNLVPLIAGILIVVAMGAAGIIGVQKISNTYQEYGMSYGEDTKAAIDAQSYAKRAEGHLALYLSLGDEEDRGKFSSRIDSLNEQIEILEDTVVSLSGKEHLKKLKGAAIGLSNTGEEIIKTYDADPENFNAQDNVHLFRAIRNFASIARSEGVALAQNKIIDTAVAASSDGKQAESHLLFLYLNFGEQKDKENYYTAMGNLKQNLFILEGEVVERNEREDLQKMQSSTYEMETLGDEIIEIYDAAPSKFSFTENKEKIIEFQDASAAVRSNGVELAKYEIDYSGENIGSAGDEANKIRIIIIGLAVLSILLLITLNIFMNKIKK